MADRVAEGIAFFGWEVADAAVLDALGRQARGGRCQVAKVPGRSPMSVTSKDLIVFNDPNGNRLELFHGAETASDPFRPGRSHFGLPHRPARTGPRRAQCRERTDNRLMPFYRDTARVPAHRLSTPSRFSAYFMHVNPRHHSLALIQTGKNAVHHIMMELYQFDDVGQGYDIAPARRGRVATTLGRHTSDFITSFYTWTPSGFHGRIWMGRALHRLDPGRPMSARKARACGAMTGAGCRKPTTPRRARCG